VKLVTPRLVGDQIAGRTAVSQFIGQAAAYALTGADNTNRLFRPGIVVLMRENWSLTSYGCKLVSRFVENFRKCEHRRHVWSGRTYHKDSSSDRDMTDSKRGGDTSIRSGKYKTSVSARSEVDDLVLPAALTEIEAATGATSGENNDDACRAVLSFSGATS
jgi:hypothetical protein